MSDDIAPNWTLDATRWTLDATGKQTAVDIADKPENTMTQPILIVGAGPVGMTTASELSRYGVPVRIVDKVA